MEECSEEELWEGEMPEVDWDFRREGRAWGDNVRQRYNLTPEKIELIHGKLFCTEAERVVMLGLLLENVGLDKAVRLGDPQSWREAVAALDAEPLE